MSNHGQDDDRLNEEKIEELRSDVRALQDYLREQATRHVAQVAYSVDGRTFDYEAPLTLAVPVGCYIQLETADDQRYLGQVVTKEVVKREGAELGIELTAHQKELFPEGISVSSVSDRLRVSVQEGTGVLLGRVTDETITATSDDDIFHEATISRADASLVNGYLAGSAEKASLPIGQVLYVDGEATVRLDASGFNRHSFLCGQSGSGKTFSLGIVLEQLLLETDLRIVVIDPNSDFVSLNRLRSLDDINRVRSDPISADAYDRLTERYEQMATGVEVYRPKALATDGDEVLRVRFGDLSRSEQATVLQLDPLDDSAEFNTFWHTVTDLGQQEYSWDEVRNAVAHDFTAEARQLGLRIENLGLAEWDVWSAPGESSLLDTLGRTDWRCLVLDVGTLGSAAEKTVITNAVLRHLWRQRTQRQPTLVVIDEAHNVCPQDPLDDLQAISSETVGRIAAEGRKFGLYLLLSTQRPGKIPENVLSQCDNLMLMRMNSSSDLDTLSAVLSHVPESLLAESLKFGLGEAILAGRIVQNPTFAKFEGRLSVEGGSDIPTTWARRRE